MPKITEMFAYVVADKDEDDEGVIGMQTAEGWLPLVGADVARAGMYRQAAVLVATQLEKPVRLLHFSGPPELLDTILPIKGVSDA